MSESEEWDVLAILGDFLEGRPDWWLWVALPLTLAALVYLVTMFVTMFYAGLLTGETTLFAYRQDDDLYWRHKQGLPPFGPH